MPSLRNTAEQTVLAGCAKWKIQRNGQEQVEALVRLPAGAGWAEAAAEADRTT